MQKYLSWPFVEAEKILSTFEQSEEIILATGYGPSGLPHIGTFGEVLRTVYVANALRELAPRIRTRILAFSDDMDGLRKVPDNVPNREMLSEHLGRLLTSIPDPFGTAHSYGHHMNGTFCEFLDRFGFEYEFKSATECYRSGVYDEVLLKLLERYEAAVNILLPTLGEERQKSYSPFLPVCQKTQKVLQVPIVETNAKRGTVSYRDEEGNLVETRVTGGCCKLQWKADWGMRWAAFGVQYESHGKDLTPSAKPAVAICKLLGGKPPVLFPYELFLDKEGKKISKSKGNGFSVDEWLACAPYESLALYMFLNPKRAKRLCHEIVPKFVDDYLSLVNQYHDDPANFDNPVWHIHNGKVPKLEMYGLTFCLLINIASACNAEDVQMLKKLIKRYRGGVDIENNSTLEKLLEFSVAYCKMFVLNSRSYKVPNEVERRMLANLSEALSQMDDSKSSDEIQNVVFEVGKMHLPHDLRTWFKTLYEVLLGQEDGPRFGSFVKLYGIDNTVKLITNSLTTK